MPAKLKNHAIAWKINRLGKYPEVVLHRNATGFTLAIIEREGARPTAVALTKPEAAKLVEAIESMSQCSWRDASMRSSTLGNVTEKPS